MRRVPAWLILILLFVLVYASGVLGLKGEQSWAQFFTSRDLPDRLYSVLQLFVLEGRAVGASTGDAATNGTSAATAPWPIWLAAFAAPVVTIFAFLQLVWRDLTGAISGLCHRFVYRGHTVVVGYGWRGQKFSSSVIALGKRVVAIDLPDMGHPGRTDLGARFRLLTADVRTSNALRHAGAARASEIVIFCGNELENITIARHVSHAIARAVKNPSRFPRIICHANSSVQRDQLIADQSQGGSHAPIVEFYSPEQAAARQCVERFSPMQHAVLHGRNAPHLAIFGDGALLRELVRHVAISAQGPTPVRASFTLFSQEDLTKDTFLAAAATVCNITRHRVDLTDANTWRELLLKASERPTQYAIAPTNHVDAVDLALSVRQVVEGMVGHDAAVVYGAGPMGSTLIEAAPTARPFNTTLISPFGENPDVLSWGQVVAQEQDALARTNHLAYLDELKRSAEPINFIAKPASRPWSQLSEHFRASNRSFVDHLTLKLDLIGCALAPAGNARPAVLSDDELDLLARAEHNRWTTERQLSGWTFAQVRDDREKHHPDLVDWEALSHGTQAYDRALVAALPTMLARGGQRIARVIRLGVTGHRHANINVKNRKLTRAIDTALESIAEAHPDAAFKIVSPLAEGADRLVARRAMDKLSAGLVVPLPLPLGDYREDFLHAEGADAAALSRASFAEFEALLESADDVFELPPIAARHAPDYRSQHYAALGAWLIRSCDHLIGVWDGAPAAGLGGTAQVISWAQGEAIPAGLDRPDLGALDVQIHIIPFERPALCTDKLSQVG